MKAQVTTAEQQLEHGMAPPLALQGHPVKLIVLRPDGPSGG